MNPNGKISTLGVFCGASSGNLPIYQQSTEELADTMSKAGISLVYGGAKVGLMGLLAERMLKNGSKVIGVMPKSLIEVEIAHHNLTELHVVDTMSERKALISELCDGFVLLPGGTGSLDEFFEMQTLAQLGYHPKPCGILNSFNYYDHLLKFLDHAVSQGFLNQSYRDMIIVDSATSALFDKFQAYQAPKNVRWKTKS